MSLNLALQKGKSLNTAFLFQTPTKVTLAAATSDSPADCYKKWLLESRNGNFVRETNVHFTQLDELLAGGWKFTIV